MKHLLLSLSLLACFTAEAQRKTFYASDFPELTAANGAKQVKDLWPTTAQAEARLPNAYKWWTIIAGQTPASFLTMTIFPACENEVVWAGNGSGFAPGNQCTSRNSFDASGVYGTYMVNVACRIFQGKLIGAGTSIGSDKGNASTELRYDHARWQDPAPIRAVILSTNWGTTDYLESVFITGFRITGGAPGWYDPSYTQHGIAVRMMGETAAIERCYVNDHNGNGIWVNGSGPGHIQHVSCFDNNLAGIYVTNDKTGGTAGNSLGMLTIMHCSFDNNAQQILNIRGGAMAIFYIKSEYALSATRGKPNKAGPVLEAHGWNDITIDHITDSHGPVPAGAAFVLETTANVSRVTINHYTQIATNDNVNIGRSALIADPRAKKVWQTTNPNTAKYNPLTIDWRASGNSSTVTCTEPLVEGVFNGSTRLGIASTYAGYNYAAATPVWDPTGGTVTPPPTPCTYTYSAWGPCTNGTETRTVTSATPAGCTGTPDLSRTCTITPTCTWVQSPETCGTCSNNSQTCTIAYVSSLAGCTPTTAKPADITRTQTCGTPPPTGSAIDPNDVLVVWNSSDARTQAWASSYADKWGIPSGNVISVAAGTSHDASTTVATAIRTAVQGQGKQFTVLAWEYPSRQGSQSITSLVTFGPRNVSSLTVSPLYDYTGFKPRTDKGVAPCFLLVNGSYIRKDAHGTKPTGSGYMVLANDGPTGCNSGGVGASCNSVNCSPRGKARKGQTAPELIVWDNTCTSVGGGDNDCNSLSGGCWIKDNGVPRKPIQPVIANYGSGPSQCCDEATATRPAVIWRKGYYGDHVTSTGGNLPNGAGQKPLTWHLDRGASLSVGSVIEPWQDKSGNSPGSLVEQFVNVTKFHPRFTSGLPVGVAAWSSVQCPDRMLFAGDPLCAPFK